MKKLLVLMACFLFAASTAHAEIEKKVKVSQNDNTSGFLNGKIVCGSNTTCIENNDGANESLEISALSSGTGITLDLADDNVNESTSVLEIATIGDTFNVVTEPSADKLRFNMTAKWPLSDQAVGLQTNGSNCSAGNAPLGIDAAGVAEGCFDVATQAELNVFVPATATALAANGANCGTGNSPLGVDALGASEGCFDVEEEGAINSTAVSGNASDDAVLLGSASNAAAWSGIPACLDSAGQHLNYNASTNTFVCGTTGSGSGYNTIQDEGGSLTQRQILNFIGSGISCVDDGGTKTNCTVTGGGASAYDQLQEEGSNITQRSTINFVGTAATISDTGSKSQLAFDSEVNGIADLGTSGMVARTGAGTFDARTLTQPASGLTITDGDGISGNPTFALANDLSALEAMSGTGLVARTGSETYAQRSIAGTSNEISVSNGSGVAGDPTISLPATVDLSGKTSFATVAGTGPSLSSNGHLAVDTTQDQFKFYSSAATHVVSGTHEACVTIPDLIATDDNMQFLVADRDITITGIGCRYEGTGSTVATIALENSKTGTAMTHTGPTCVTGNNNATFQSVTANNAIVSGDGVRWDTTNTPSPLTDDYTICVRWKEDSK